MKNSEAEGDPAVLRELARRVAALDTAVAHSQLLSYLL